MRGSRTDPASTCWRTTSGRSQASAPPVRRRPSGSVTIELRCRKVCSSLSCSRAVASSCPGCGMRLLLGLAPGLDRVAAVETSRQRPEFFLRRMQLALGDGEQAIGGERNALFQSQLLLKGVATEPERRLGPGPHDRFRGSRHSCRLPEPLRSTRRRGRRAGADRRRYGTPAADRYR